MRLSPFLFDNNIIIIKIIVNIIINIVIISNGHLIKKFVVNLTCVASAKGKGKGGGGGGEKMRRRTGRREGKGALAIKAHKIPCIYVQNLDVKC